MKFANLIADMSPGKVRNIGDDYQSFAVEHLYNYMGIDTADIIRIMSRDLATYDGDEIVLPINYFIANVIHPYLSPKIKPVYLGVSLISSCVTEVLCLKEFEPIGCRDAYTMQLLKDKGIDAYLNGCLTLILPSRGKREAPKTFFVDVSDELLTFVPPELLDDAVHCTQMFFHQSVSERQSRAALERMRDEARLVVTSRLHCAVPCIAMGIPVVFARDRITFRSNWLGSLIPLYDRATFENIDWCPSAINVESIKRRMLENASRRISDSLSGRKSKAERFNLFESDDSSDYSIDALETTIDYLDKNWKADESRAYVLWGKTQLAEVLYQYITSQYPRAYLNGFIDLYREDGFHGHEAKKLDYLDNIASSTLFICAESAGRQASIECDKRGVSDVVLCWENANSSRFLQTRNVNEKKK